MKKFFFVLTTFAFSISLLSMQVNFSGKPQKTITEKYRILITHRKGLGEEEMARRVSNVARTLGIDSLVIAERPNTFVRRIFPNLSQFIAKQYRPNVILSLQGGQIQCPQAKRFITLTHGSDYYFGSNPVQPLHTLINFDGFLIAFPDKDRLTSFLSPEQSNDLLIWYTTCGATPYEEISSFRLFYCGSNWSTSNYGRKYEKLFSRLDNTGYLDVYGKKSQWRHTPKSYRGFIKTDGESIIRTMHNTGVALVLHAPDHLEGKVPTARIFEAAAACNVIISDSHSFIKNEFGNSVLYIDESKTSEEIFDQIDAHMKWIQENPKQAKVMAKKAHKIFIEKFTLEDQLRRFIHACEMNQK